jgi:translocator protein
MPSKEDDTGNGAGRAIGVAIIIAELTAGAAFIGGQATSTSVNTWYDQLAKPAWTPPSWVFGPAWTTLYVMMAVAAFLVWRRAGFKGGGPALICYVFQLALNALWSVIFFGMQAPGLAFIEICILWGAIGLTFIAFWRIRKFSAWLLAPYWAWTTFAGALNYAIWQLN